MNEKKKERSYIIVYKDFMDDDSYDFRDKYINTLIKGLSLQSFNGVTVASVDNILTILGFVSNSKNKLAIKESIEKLVAGGELLMYSDFGCSNIVKEVSYSNTYFFKPKIRRGSYYSKIYHDDFTKLLNIDDKNKMKMFPVYYSIISKLYDAESSDGYTLINVEDIGRETGINRKTVSKYTKLLMDSKLIYYNTNKIAKDKVKNAYSRWENRAVVDALNKD